MKSGLLKTIALFTSIIFFYLVRCRRGITVVQSAAWRCSGRQVHLPTLRVLLLLRGVPRAFLCIHHVRYLVRTFTPDPHRRVAWPWRLATAASSAPTHRAPSGPVSWQSEIALCWPCILRGPGRQCLASSAAPRGVVAGVPPSLACLRPTWPRQTEASVPPLPCPASVSASACRCTASFPV